MALNVATQVAGKVLHCAMWEKFLATLRNALRKVELTSTIAATKKLRQMSVAGYVTLGNIRATCIATKLRDKLQEKLPSVTAPLAF